jgi:hypothetical protein
MAGREAHWEEESDEKTEGGAVAARLSCSPTCSPPGARTRVEPQDELAACIIFE